MLIVKKHQNFIKKCLLTDLLRQETNFQNKRRTVYRYQVITNTLYKNTDINNNKILFLYLKGFVSLFSINKFNMYNNLFFFFNF